MNGFYNVRPRYSPGSPAMVNEDTALRVARHERQTYQDIVEHEAAGESLLVKAKALGLAWIVESVGERAGGFDVLDMLTDETYRRPFRWRAGDRVDYFHPERGWVLARVVTTTDNHQVSIRLDSQERWEDPTEVARERLRLTHSVRKPEPAEPPA